MSNTLWYEVYFILFGNMKARISATIDPYTLKLLEKIMKEHSYRNYSHAIEEAIKVLSVVKNDKNKKWF